MTFRTKYTDAQRQAALRLVDELERVTGKRRGTVAAAATKLGLHPSIVAHWVAIARTTEDARTKEEEPRTSNSDRRPPPSGVAALLRCELCGRAMVQSRTRDGVAAFACPAPCRRRSSVRCSEVEHVIGQMIVDRLSVGGRPALHHLTVAHAVEQAPRFLERIVVGIRSTSLRVQWRLAPLPVQADVRRPSQVRPR